MGALLIQRNDDGTLHYLNDPDEVTFSKELIDDADRQYLTATDERITITLAGEVRTYRITSDEGAVVRTVRERTS